MGAFSNVETVDTKAFFITFQTEKLQQTKPCCRINSTRKPLPGHKSFRNYARYSRERSLHYQNGPFYPSFVQL